MRLIKVNTLAVAKRWKETIVKDKKEKGFTGADKRIGIWELPYQVTGRGARYKYSDKTMYVVGHTQAVESRVSHLGKRIDEEAL
mgnify:FL=1|tara:strand:+ start:1234 stop:1485 length:252 start_codon:yes stop_codon:yes gene_type:complete